MTPSSAEDYRWLISDEAAPFLSETQIAIEEQINALSIAKKLRKRISPERSALVMEQAQLRIKGSSRIPRICSSLGEVWSSRRGN